MSRPKTQQSSSVRYFKVFIKDVGRPSMMLLEYLEQNINVINDMGIKLKFSKIYTASLDKEMIDKLAARGILRLPALVTDENKIKLGVKNITALFDDNKLSYRQYLAAQKQPGASPAYLSNFSDDKQLAAFYASEMNEEALNRDKASYESNVFEGATTKDFDRRVNDNLRSRNLKMEGPSQNLNTDTEMARRSSAAKPRKAATTRTPDTNNIADPEDIPSAADAKFDAMFNSKFMQNAGEDLY